MPFEQRQQCDLHRVDKEEGRHHLGDQDPWISHPCLILPCRNNAQPVSRLQTEIPASDLRRQSGIQ